MDLNRMRKLAGLNESFVEGAVDNKLDAAKSILKGALKTSTENGWDFEKSDARTIMTALRTADAAGELTTDTVYLEVDHVMKRVADIGGQYNADMQRRMDFFSGVTDKLLDLISN